MDRTTALRGAVVNSVPKTALPGILATIIVTLYLAVVLEAEDQLVIIGLVAGGGAAALLAAKLGWIAAVQRSYTEHERMMDACAVAVVIALTVIFHNSHFILLLLATVLIYVIACLGLNLQFGYAGMLNFAGAAMLGLGGYTAAVLGTNPNIPTILILPAGGLMAALIGSVLLPPMLRTQGHYSAVVTIAFSLLFMTFLEVYPGFGGPQGLPVRAASFLGWEFNNNLEIAGARVAFYVNYVVLGLVLTILVAALVRRIERSWMGLNLDAVRSDEIASKCFGVNVALWKTVAFTTGNFIVGLAGSFYALMLGYIAPANFTFGDSLILVTIILLGGLGSIWGVILTTVIVIILPEKLQTIQEYRFLLYAVLVTLVLLFRPEGLIARAPRQYFTGWRP